MKRKDNEEQDGENAVDNGKRKLCRRNRPGTFQSRRTSHADKDVDNDSE